MDDAAARDNLYQYNGKELNNDFGLGWNDYGARWYDASVGRFPSVDPIIEKFPYLNPYNYASNSPVTSIDLWGLQGIPISTNDLTQYMLKSSATVRTGLFAINHPIAALNIWFYSKSSENISTNAQRFSSKTRLTEGAEGSQLNAFRHTLWQATIASTYGEDVAKAIGYAHEANPLAVSRQNFQMNFSNLSNADEAVDLLNNMIGRTIGVANPNADMQDLAMKVLEYFRDKGLWTATELKNKDGQTTGYHIQKEKIGSQAFKISSDRLGRLDSNGFTPEETKNRHRATANSQREAMNVKKE
jgi:RHS repeat-associated protein